MAVGRISGPLLKANLERNGIDLAVETDLLYIDVTNDRIGIKTTTPQYELDVNGIIRSDRINTDFLSVADNYNIGNVNITSTVANLELQPATAFDRTVVIGDLEVTGEILNFSGGFDIVNDASSSVRVNLGTAIRFSDGTDTVVSLSSDAAHEIIEVNNTSTLDSVTGRGNTTTNDITVGSATASSLFTSLIDTTDSSAITVVPAATFNSNLTVENSLIVGNDVAITGNTTSTGDITAVRFIGDGSALTNLQITLGSQTTGNYMENVSGTTNEIEITHTPGEGSTATIGLPDDVTIGNELTVTTSLFTPLIDTTDSSTLTITPAVIMNSDLTVENDLVVTNKVTATEFIGDGSKLTGLVANFAALNDTDVVGQAADTLIRFNGSVYVPAQTAEDASGNVTVASDLIMPDNSKIILGDASDLQIYHDGTSNFIVNDNSSGSHMFIDQRAENKNIVIRSDNGSGGNANYIRAEGLTGEVQLYYYGSQKLATKSTGVDVTGNLVVSGQLETSTIDTSDSSAITVTPAAVFSSDVTVENNLNVSTIDTADSSAITIIPEATFNSDVTVENSLRANNDVYVGHHIDFSTTVHTHHAEYQEGRVWYDAIHKTFNYYSDIPNVIHEIGLEQHIRVYNNSGSAILKGQPLYFTGNYESGHVVPTVGLANATSASKYDAQGLAAADIANGSYGFCQLSGQLFDLDTSGLTAGQHFYVGLTDGALQNASPSYPNYPILLGWVVKSHATDGVVNIHLEQHTMDTFRVVNDAHFGNNVVVDGDLTVNGTQTITSQANISAGSAFIYLNTGDTIGEANTTFTGSGLDDAYFSGHYTGTGTTNYYVRIDSTGTPDTFEWSKDNFSSTEATGVAITGSDQTLDQGISINFGATTGHTSSDVWSGTAAPTNVDTGFFSNRNTGGTGVGYTHAGLFFDITDEKWKLVEEYDPEPDGTIDTSHASYNEATLSLDTLEAATGTFSTAVTVGGNNVLTTASEIALGTSTTGNYVATIAGTTNEVEVSGSGSESAAVTIGLPNDVTIGNNLTVTNDILLSDNSSILIGTGNDLELVHNGTNTQINNYAGALQIIQREDNSDVVIYSDDSTGGIAEYFRADGSTGEAILSHYGTSKFNTTTTGAQITDSLLLGTDDTSNGSLYLYGDGTGSAFGGFIRLYNAADHDTTNEYFTIKAQSNQFIVEKADGTDLFTYIDSDTSFRFPDGTVYVGSPDNTKGNLHIQGDGAGSVNGGEIRIYNAADHDSNVNYYSVYAESEDFLISYASTDFLQYDYDISQWKMPRSGGLSVTGNVVVSGQLEVSTIDTSDSSAITIIPAATFNSDVTIENDLRVTNAIENSAGQTILPAVLGSATQVLTVNAAGTGVEWAASSGGGGVARTEEFPTVTNGSPNVTMGAAYTLDQLDVYLNGARLRRTTDFTVSGTTLTFTENLVTGDIVALYAYDTAENLITGNWSDLNDVNVTGASANAMVRYDGSNWTVSQTTEDSNGDITTSGNVKINYSSTTVPALSIESTDSTSSASPEIELYKNSTSSDGHYLGQIKFAGENDTGGKVNYAKITGKILDNTNGTEDGILEFAFQKAGSLNISARFRSDSLQLINGTNFVVNGTSTFESQINVTVIDSSDSSAITIVPAAVFNSDLTVENDIIVSNKVTATEFIGDGSNLTGINAGATGAGGDEIFWENGQTVTTDYSITENKNAMTAGPITINTGITVTIPVGSEWSIV